MKVRAVKFAKIKLEQYGIVIADALLDLYAEQTRAEILGAVNRKAVPEGLLYAWGDMIAGNAILAHLGKTETESDQGGGVAVSSVKEGDVSVSFDVSCSPVAVLKTTALEMASLSSALIARYRRLSW